LALDLLTASSIVKAVRANLACRATIEGPKASRVVMEILGVWHLAGGVRNAAMMVVGLGREDQAFVRYSCTGIAQVTQRVIFSEMLAGRLPKVQSSLVRRRKVNGFEHKGTGVVMKDGSDYVFDWWPTLTPGNPLISTLAQWVNAGTTVEYEQFKEFP
jgi:hypothetical protein